MTCPECGCPYEITLLTCPECGCPNNSISTPSDINGFSVVCSCCGAPANGYRVCQWCGSPIEYIGHKKNTSMSANRTILECEFKRMVNDRTMYPYIICHISVNGHELLQLSDDCSNTGLTLFLMGVFGAIQNNLNLYHNKHSFYLAQNGVYARSFGVDYNSAAQVADEILQQVYEVHSETVVCNFEYGQRSSSIDGNVAAAAIGGVLLGSLFDNF